MFIINEQWEEAKKNNAARDWIEKKALSIRDQCAVLIVKSALHKDDRK